MRREWPVSKRIMKWILGERAPRLKGRIRVSGAEDSIQITRDHWGIPHIEAKTEGDAWYGLGFCHAQDRRFQIESLVRIAQGTFSEIVGKDGITIDRLMRRLNFPKQGRDRWNHMPPEIQVMMESYVRGVNEGTQSGIQKLPHEYVLLKAEPKPIEIEDAFALMALQSFLLAANWDAELARLKTLELEGPERLQAIDLTYAAWHEVTDGMRGEQLQHLVSKVEKDLQTVGSLLGAGASNNWVVSGEKSVTGRPLLANDPHLMPLLPAPWYLFQTTTPDWSGAGASFVGFPGLIAGHNHHAAWGVTAGMVDTTDFFIEELQPDGLSVRGKDGVERCEDREETIHVKNSDPIQEKILVTKRGPLLSPALENVNLSLSIKSTWMSDHGFRGVFGFHHVKSFEEFRESAQNWPMGSLNYVYADQSGDIGWQLMGQPPKREAHQGAIPYPAWRVNEGWEKEGEPFSRMPHGKNPKKQFYATANNRPASGEEFTFLGEDWLDGYRVTRITEKLDSQPKWSLEDHLKLQIDEYCLAWREIRKPVLNALSAPEWLEAEPLRLAGELLSEWDGHLSADSKAATLFELFLIRMMKLTLEVSVPNAKDYALGKGFHPDLIPYTMFSCRRTSWLVRLIRTQPPQWFENDSWDDAIRKCLGKSIEELRSRFGKNTDRWKWGEVRPLELEHLLATKSKLLKPLFNLGPFPWGGDANTVAQTCVNVFDPFSNPLAIANLRFVVDVGDWEKSRFVLAGGQSGNPLSDHYGDLLEVWKKGEGVPIETEPERIKKVTRHVLLLEAENVNES